ncbi:MAG: V-type ATP synthase subunit K [Sphaerochaetaceae bacterium]|jgi:V/A-type H+-transporting ATPase subunit K|nr:V-type ATP synthase subunit K [Sphaerochaetaceae bacterium]
MNIQFIGMACALCLSAIGSGLGAGCASQAAVGGWKKCYAAGKPAPFIMVAFAGAPLTQTIYGFLLMGFIRDNAKDPLLALCVGVLGGFAIGLSAYLQGRVSACACDSLSESGKGTANYFTVIGVVETVALFSLVFCLLLLTSN